MPTVMALFQSDHDAERAVLELSLLGFTEKDVSMVVFAAQPHPQEGRQGLIGWLARGGFLGDTIDRSDGTSVMDGVGVGAVIFGLLGMIYGSRWHMGPVAGSTLGFLAGGVLGYVLDKVIPEKRRDQMETSQIPGMLLLLVTASDDRRVETASRLLKATKAKQLAVLPEGLPTGGKKAGASS